MSELVARYYDRNTGRFLLVGRGRDTRSIHRELWGPGVTSAGEAAAYVDRLVADAMEEASGRTPRSVVDFGCGVGGTLVSLARRFPEARLQGVTISARQVDIANRLLDRAEVGARVSVMAGDFHEVDLGFRADAAVAIESLAHSHDLPSVLANTVAHLRPGGALVVADDFLAAEPERLSPAQRRCVDRFRSGWRLRGLGTVARLVGEAGRVGLVLRRDADLTELTRPGSRVRDRLVAVVSPLADRLGLAPVPFFGNLIGGNALQTGLMEGFIRYRLLTFESLAGEDRPAADHGPQA